MSAAASWNPGRATLQQPPEIPLKTYIVSGKHISPYFSGWVEIRFNGEGIQCRWYGETGWAEMMTWAELAFKAGIRNEQYRDELKFTRQDAYDEGYAAGLEAARKESK